MAEEPVVDVSVGEILGETDLFAPERGGGFGCVARVGCVDADDRTVSVVPSVNRTVMVSPSTTSTTSTDVPGVCSARMVVVLVAWLCVEVVVVELVAVGAVSLVEAGFPRSGLLADGTVAARSLVCENVGIIQPSNTPRLRSASTVKRPTRHGQNPSSLSSCAEAGSPPTERVAERGPSEEAQDDHDRDDMMRRNSVDRR